MSADVTLYCDHAAMFTFPTEQAEAYNSTRREMRTGTRNQSREHSYWTENLVSRPKSSPSTIHANHQNGGRKMRRPKTAHPSLSRSECERVYQVEHEPTRKHKMENHLSTKRGKPPPWQKTLDGPLVPFVVGPGYILSRSKSKYNMTIKTDNFFEGHGENEKPRPRFIDPEKDTLIAQLQQQINDLTLYLEEERMNHRQSRFKASQTLKDKAEELGNQHQENIRQIVEEHEKEMDEQTAKHAKDFEKYRIAAESQINRMKSEIEFLQGAFDSYKGTLHQEMDERWKKKEDEFRLEQEEIKQQALHELKTKLITERNAERVTSQKDHQRQIEAIRKETKKELGSLQKRFSNAAADLERLKKVQVELEELKVEFEALQVRYEETISHLKKTTSDLTDTKVRLMTFEEQFEEKVSQVDDKYKQMMHDLMSQNTELRRLYVKKCGELFDEKAQIEQNRLDRVKTVKETMQTLTEIRHRSNVSLVGGLPPTPDTTPQRAPRTPLTETPEHPRNRRPLRPSSAPVTLRETGQAEANAGTLDEIQPCRDLPIRPQSCIPATRPDVEEMRRQLHELTNTSISEKLLEALG